MRSISIVSKSGAEGGGASIVAAQLAACLPQRRFAEIDHWVGVQSSGSDHLRLRESTLDDLTFRASRFGSRVMGYSDFFAMSPVMMRKKDSDYDLIHLHDISGTLSPFSIKSLSRRAPIVWTFHDCSPFTGGCIYPLDCATYEKQCGACPQLSQWPLLAPFDRTTTMRKWRHEIVNAYVSAIICPSRWIADQARKSGVNDSLIHTIHNSIDTFTFKPIDKRLARIELEIPKDAFVIFLGSATFNNPYKGIGDAFKAISELQAGVHVVMVGKNSSEQTLPNGPVYHLYDYTSDRRELATRYAACDVVIFPSLADNFPLMLLESMASGTPAIAYATGGIPEAIDHDANGWLAPKGDIEGLVVGLRIAMKDTEKLHRWSLRARSKAVSHFTESRFLNEHISVYEKVISERKFTAARR